ncbi:MAG: ABC transporter permease subunit [Alphaproteobacteria bacterium]|nr:ABC transporter permease subunit [Alphaproteobacteria bacterium]
MRIIVPLALAAALVVVASPPAPAAEVTVGSKKFTESVILGEMAALLARSAGAEVRHRRELGGTRILWNALVRGDIDVYPEYTGTLRAEILARENIPDDRALAAVLARRGLVMGPPLGFNNSYAIGMLERTARERGIATVSDLRRHPDLVLGFGSEFLNRADGWPGLKARYGLTQGNVRGLDHDLAYRGLVAGDIEVMDLYATDAEIDYYGIRVLRDDLGYFPTYDAVLLYRADLVRRAPAVVHAFERLAGRIDSTAMAKLNAQVKKEGKSDRDVAATFLRAALTVGTVPDHDADPMQLWRRLGPATLEHLVLVGISLAAAIVVAIPLGIAAYLFRGVGHGVLAVVGIVQTIPALALLVFMIPLLGIGAVPAMAALFLYSLLPITRNTHAGLVGIAEPIRQSALALGLGTGDRLLRIELPLAAPLILAGIKTAAVINVGTATLGALIGAGGYGQAILTGIRLDDVGLILEGAIPAAVLALVVQYGFEWAERSVVPRGLRLGKGTARP